MEQATNLFQKGLLLDTSPMVQGNDTLTDCLNGTIVTMNGNEVILQNDMGNRRVDNAFLPSGYQPVGMKEYGGIIYVASYNPITNKSLLGSFPSPLRKISSYDDENLGFTGDIVFGTEELKEFDYLDFLITDTIQIPLTSDTSLHAGDKFIVYGTIAIDGLIRGSESITNYNNVFGTNVLSPKNKLYTLSLGVMNSKNEYVDITESLVRWELEGNEAVMIDFIDNESPLYKFNRGYFIAPNVPKNFLETKDDAMLIEKRKTIAANTYSYKLIGPLYLKVVYNCINSINYNIYGEKIDDTHANLTILSIVTYNCPDGASSGGSNSDYADLEIGEINDIEEKLNGFDLYIDLETTVGSNPPFASNNINYNQPISPIYDEFSGLYSVEISKTYNNVLSLNNGLFKYILAVGEKNKYLRGLSSKGVIDFTKLGSGDLEISGWRFYWNNGNLILNINTEAYPKHNEKFTNFKVKIDNLEVISRVNVGFGLISETITNLPSLKVFLAEITYTIQNNDGLYKKVGTNNFIYKDVPDSEVTYIIDDSIYWILTTDLFNEFFSSGSKQIFNYAKPKDIEGHTCKINEIDPSNEYTGEQDLIKQKLLISPSFDVLKTNVNSPISTNISGSLITNTPDDIEVVCTQSKNFNIDTNISLTINPLSYPDYLLWITKFNSDNVLVLDVLSNIDDLDSTIKQITNYTTLDSWKFVEIENLTITNGVISGTLKWKDLFRSKVSATNLTIENGFDTILHYFLHIDNNIPNYCSYSGCAMGGDINTPGKDDHYIGFIANFEGPTYNKEIDELSRETGFINTEITLEHWKADNSEGDDWGLTWETGNLILSLLFLDWSSRIDNTKIFAYLMYTNSDSDLEESPFWYVIDWAKSYKKDDFNHYNPKGWTGVHKSAKNRSRLLWKTDYENWAYINHYFIESLSNIFTLFSDYLSTTLGIDLSKLIFCRYLECPSDGLYIAKGTKFKEDKEYENLVVTLSVILLLNSSVHFVENLRPEGCILNFAENFSRSTANIDIATISSSPDFTEYINNGPILKNIDINTGRNIDSKGNPLSIRNIYLDTTTNLKLLENYPLTTLVKNDKKEYELVLKENKINKGALLWLYDVYNPAAYNTDSGLDVHSFINYQNVRRLLLNQLKYTE